MGEIMKITNIYNILLATGFVFSLVTSQIVAAATITTSLGNTAHGFVDGSSLAVIGDVDVAQAASTDGSPFNLSIGVDSSLFGADFSTNWTFIYGAISDTILSASLTIGIYDHDSSASGSQLASYGIDGNDLTTTLDSLFEAGGGAADAQYNEYTIALGAGLFSDLADGSSLVSLALQGNGLVPVLFVGGFQETSTNGANLIFSTLTIETEDAQTVPEPGSLVLVSLGFLLLGIIYRRREFQRV